MEARDLNWADANAMNRFVDDPDYRVDFWEQFVAPPGSDQAKMGYGVRSYLLSQADNAIEALEWARQHAGDRSLVLFALVPQDGRAPLRVRLLGNDPTYPNHPHLEA